ncbi:MAG TPA: hypothetical protein VMN78_07860 [Longimicrobiales bacterium]|nr:hypothetical protein [Longimicrobiales bacterium]
MNRRTPRAILFAVTPLLLAPCADSAAGQMETPSRIWVGEGIEVLVSREEPGMGVQGVGWRVVNLTGDSLRVDMTKTFYASPSGRLVGTDQVRGFVLEPFETINGGRFTGDDIFDLWDDFFYGEDLSRDERIGRITLSATVHNLSAERRAEARRQEQRLAEERARREQEASERRRREAEAERLRLAQARADSAAAAREEQRRAAARAAQEIEERQREREAEMDALVAAAAPGAEVDVGDGSLVFDLFGGGALGGGSVAAASDTTGVMGVAYGAGARYVHRIGSRAADAPIRIETTVAYSESFGTTSGTVGQTTAALIGDAFVSTSEFNGHLRLWYKAIALGLNGAHSSYTLHPDGEEDREGSFSTAAPEIAVGFMTDRDGYAVAWASYATVGESGEIRKFGFEMGMNLMYLGFHSSNYTLANPIDGVTAVEHYMGAIGVRFPIGGE